MFSPDDLWGKFSQYMHYEVEDKIIWANKLWAFIKGIISLGISRSLLLEIIVYIVLDWKKIKILSLVFKSQNQTLKQMKAFYTSY